MVNWVRPKAPKGGQAAGVTFFIKLNLISVARQSMDARVQTWQNAGQAQHLSTRHLCEDV
jgi:hypothetical protein